MRVFGTRTIFSATSVVYDGANLTVTWDIPNDAALFVTGIASVDTSAKLGNSLIVTSLKYAQGAEHILSNDKAATPTNYVNGVPLAHIAQLGGGARPSWFGEWAQTRRILDQSLETSGLAPSEYGAGLARARSSLEAIYPTLDVAGFVVSRGKLVMTATDISVAGTDKPTAFTLEGIVLGRRYSLALASQDRGSPFWVHYTPIALASGTTPIDAHQTLSLPMSVVGAREAGARFTHLATRATLIADATRIPATSGLESVLLDNSIEGADLNSQWVMSRAPALAFATGLQTNRFFERPLYDDSTANWLGSAVLGAASTLYLSDYLLAELGA